MKLKKDFYKELLDNLYDGVYFVERNKRITYWNKAAEAISGFNGFEVLGKSCSDNILMHVDDLGNSLCFGSCPLSETLADGVPRAAEAYLRHKEGHRVPVAIRIVPIRNKNGKITGAVELFSDNSANIEAILKIKEFENLVYIDHLTGIANRSYIEIFLKSKFDEMHRYNWPFGFMFMDIDHFKDVNDKYGHDTGDMVLKMVAQTLAKNARSFDLVGRWGGEEFIYVITNVKQDGLVQAAQRLRRLVANSGIFLNGHTLRVTISAGATLARPEDTWETLLQRGDRLMYRSKDSGRNCVATDSANSLPKEGSAPKDSPTP